jgi:hypothetical protein
MDLSQTLVSFKNYDLDYEQERRNKTRTYLKISLKIFKPKMRKIFKIFPNSFDQKSQKSVT